MLTFWNMLSLVLLLLMLIPPPPLVLLLLSSLSSFVEVCWPSWGSTVALECARCRALLFLHRGGGRRGGAGREGHRRGGRAAVRLLGAAT